MNWRERFEEPVRGIAARRRGTHWVRAAVARITTPSCPMTTFIWRTLCGRRANCAAASSR